MSISIQLSTAPIDPDNAIPVGFELTPSQSRVIAAVEAIGQGELIVVTDDGDRENEGDLVCAASMCTPELMAFIIRV